MIGNSPGLGPANLEGDQSTSASLVLVRPETFSSPLLDISQALSGMEIVPARPGHVFVVSRMQWIIESVVGTQTVPLNMQIGNNPTHDNVLTSTATPSNVDTNTAIPPSPTTGQAPPALVQNFPNVPTFMDITSGAQGTGGFKVMARFIISVIWYGVGG